MFKQVRIPSPADIEYLKAHSSCPINQLCIAISNSKNQVKIALSNLDGKTQAKKILAGNRSFRSKIGKRPDLNNQFVRSAWEANFYRYLNMSAKENKITTIQYEPMDFSFAPFNIIKGPAVSYTPDFKVTYPNGTYKWIEIKGYLKPADKTKLRRFKKFFPAEYAKLTAVTGSPGTASTKFLQSIGIPIMCYYNDLNREYKGTIPYWE